MKSAVSAMTSSPKHPHRYLLSLSIATICKEKGFQSISQHSLETLTEILQAYLAELTRSSRTYCEHAHRTTPDLSDIKMALAEVGSSVYAVHMFCNKNKSHPLKALNPPKPPVEPKTLKTGMPKVGQPSYIPGNFPEYPEVHSFVRTPSLREPVNQYNIVRERVAEQRIATEDSLLRFFSRSTPTDTRIFTNINTDLYPWATFSTDPYPYLKALMPKTNNNCKSNNNTETEGQTMEERLESSSLETVDSSQNSSQSSVTSPTQNNPYMREPRKVRGKK